MKSSEQINELATALSKAQGEIKGAAKDSANPFFKSKYADLASVWDACREALCKNGLAVIQTTDHANTSNNVTVNTRLVHSSGQWVEGDLTMTPVKTDPQGVGSTITYARRYALAAIVGVAPEDDDANAGSGNSPAMTPKVKIPTDVQNKVHEQSLSCLENGDEHGLREIWNEFGADEKVVLWAMFNSQQRSSMKKLMGQ